MYYYRSASSKTLTYFLLLITVLIIVGFIFIYSSSSVFALEKFGRPHYFVVKHLIGFMVGLAGLVFFRSVPLAVIKKVSPFFFFGTLALTGMTLIPGLGVTIHGSARWLNIQDLRFNHPNC